MKRRNTHSTAEIFEVLKSSGNALSHDMIQENIGSDIDRATIYRVLNRFCEDGKVRLQFLHAALSGALWLEYV